MKTISVGSRTFDVDLVPEKPAFVLGEPIYVSFRVRNRSGDDVHVLEGGDTLNPRGRHDRFHVTVLDQAGGAVPSPLDGLGDVAVGGNSIAGPEKIPSGGVWTSRLLLQDWAKIEAPGHFAVACRRELVIARRIDEFFVAKPATADAPVEVHAIVDVSPADPPALGRIIDAYGKQASAGSGSADDDGDGPRSRALGALALIEDARVVQYLATAAARGTYSEKFVAMGALAKFDDDGALRALVQGLRDADPNIQAAAAAGLDRSKHPRAVESLWAARAGAPDTVRLTLVHALGRSRDATATARLVEMSRDPSKMVRDEAKRYLSERHP